MADTQKNIDININANTTGLKKGNETLKRSEKLLLKIQAIANKSSLKKLFEPLKDAPIPQFNVQISRTQKILNSINKRTKAWSETLQSLTGPFLSLLFFGMMLQQLFTGALKAVFEGYKKAIPEANKFNVLTNKLSANWEFFKFQLADALANSALFQRFIEFLVNSLKWLQQLSPETKKWLGFGLAVGAAFGFILFVVGQVGLGLQGLITFTSLLSGKAMNFTWGGLAKYGWMALAAAGILEIVSAIDTYAESSDIGAKAVDSLKKSSNKLISNAFEPLAEALGSVNLKIENFTDLQVYLGAIFVNTLASMITGFGAFLAAIISGWNLIQITVETAALAFLGAVLGILEVLDVFGEFDNEINVVKKSMDKLADSVISDVDDIRNAWANQLDLTALAGEAIVSPAEAVRASQAERASVTNNTIIVATPEQALADGVIDNATYQTLVDAGFYNTNLDVSSFQI